jgi:hypothetical protein
VRAEPATCALPAPVDDETPAPSDRDSAVCDRSTPIASRLYRDTLAVAVEAFVAAGLLEDAQGVVNSGRAHPMDVAAAFLDEEKGRVLLARAPPRRLDRSSSQSEAASRGFPLVEWRP